MKATAFAMLAATVAGARINVRDGPHGAGGHSGGGLADLLKLLPKGAGAGAGALPLDLLSLAPGGLMPPLPDIKVAERQTLTPELRKDAKRTKIRFGPYTMLGQGVKNRPMSFSLDPKGQAFLGIVQSGICPGDCTILAGSTGLEFANGSEAGPTQGMYVHHILTSDISKIGVLPVLPCDYDSIDVSKLPPSSSDRKGAGFIGQGEDNGKSPLYFTTRDGSTDYGFHIAKGDKFTIQADLVNYDQATRDVYVTWDLEYLDGFHGLDTTPNLMSATGCKMAQPALNKTGRAVTASKLFPILVDGKIISAKGHMHNGGEKMVLRVNGKHVCDSIPKYEGDNIQGMSDCQLDINVKKGDSISIDGIYDLEAHPLRKGVSGEAEHDMMGGDDVMAMWSLTFALDGTKKTAKRSFGF